MAFLGQAVRDLSGSHEPCLPDDNYFDLGMDSLLLVDLKDRIRDQFGVTLRMSDFFTHFTVAGLAAVVAQRGTHTDGTPASTIATALA